MVIPETAFWVFFILVAIAAMGGFAFTLLRGERIGSVDCPYVYGDTVSRARLTVCRESLGAGASSRVQLRVRVPMQYTVSQLEPQEAVLLAELLESGAARLRAP
jgi:hypothetical protein